jgi:Na+/H+-dicarboxylate symporter
MIFSAAANLGGLMTDINNQNSKPWYFKLHWQVLFALVVGVAFGWLMPRTAEDLGFVGDLFLNRLNGPDVEAVQRLVDGVLELPQQALVLLTALLASVGAAGIPMAGLVMLVVVLQAVGLPLEGIGTIIAVDRVLDMMRTATNVWSDLVGTAVVNRFEGP